MPHCGGPPGYAVPVWRIQLELEGAAPEPPVKSSRKRVFFHSVLATEGAEASTLVAQSAREMAEVKVFMLICCT